MGKFVKLAELGRISEELKKQGKVVVTTNGIFDLLHIGHVKYLQLVKQQGDILIVGVNSDLSTHKVKGPTRPIIPEDQRAELLAALACVDYVALFDEPDPRAFLEVVKPSIHVKGDDYDPEKMIETPVVRKYGGQVKIVSCRLDATTKIMKRVCEACKQEEVAR